MAYQDTTDKVRTDCCGVDIYLYLMFFFLGLGVSVILSFEVWLGWSIGGCRPEVYGRGYFLWGISALISFGVGAVFQPGDVTGCRPTSWYQPHAVWHAFTAVAIYCIWQMFRGENAAAVLAAYCSTAGEADEQTGTHVMSQAADTKLDSIDKLDSTMQ